jgi:DNA-directed RNA polymerase subunit M/transcription elongation factor TFIIS
MGKGSSYVAPDSHFISSVSVLAKNLPWAKFRKFFDTKSLVNISADDHLVLLRLLAMQELLCLDDESLLRWAKHQLFLFGFMQPSFQAKIPVSELLINFRTELDKQGLLKPFRKQCHKLLEAHETSFPTLALVENEIEKGETVDVTFISANKKPKQFRMEGAKDSRYKVKSNSGLECSSCGSSNIINLKPSQEASSLPDISFSRCQFCGNTFRN